MEKEINSTMIEKGDTIFPLIPEEKQTTSGLFVSGGEISEDYDKVSWDELLQDYTNMRNGGAVESSTISILKYPILRAGYTIVHKDPKVVDYCQWVLDNLINSFGEKSGLQELLTHIFLALDYGCSFFEKVYQNGVRTPDGKITNVIKRLAPFKPETIFEFRYDENMYFSGIEHERREANKVNSFVLIPIEKLFFYSHNSEYGDPRGRSELRPIRNLYKIKKDILLATARAQQRGAGIPEIKAKKTGLTSEEEKRLHIIGRTIGNMKSGYVITDDTTELIIHGLQIQGSPEAMLEFINREMFFNTLTEFMTSGIGQSGSRSATAEHKGSYELKCGVVTQAVENRLNLLLREICNISYLGTLEQYPEFKFNALQQTDIIAASESLARLYESNIIVKQKGDEDFIRSLFNMPEKDPDAPEGQVVLKVPIPSLPPTAAQNLPNGQPLPQKKVSLQPSALPKMQDFSKLSFHKVLDQNDQLEFVKNRFDTDGVNNMYTKLQDDAQEIILDVMNKYINYIARQVDAGQPVEMKYQAELSNRLNKLYKDSYSFGANAILKEIELAKNKSLKLDEPPKNKLIGTSQSLTRYAGRLLFNIKTVVEDQLEVNWDRSKQGVYEYITEHEFINGFKTDRRTLIEKTTDGYMDGRYALTMETADIVELYFYNSILDFNLCDVCASFTGAVMTLEEAQSVGLLKGKGRVNEHCLGSINKCRCTLMPYKVKGDFKI